LTLKGSAIVAVAEPSLEVVRVVQRARDLGSNSYGGALSGKIDIGLGSIHNPLGIEGLPNVYSASTGFLLSFMLVAGVHKFCAYVGPGE